MKASILAVGTEITSGQIINKNASVISEKLKNLGVATKIHIAVSDDRLAIKEALEYLETKSDLIFVTGGLGPTSDDFTRDVIVEWAQKKMSFDESSWAQIQNRLTSRGFTVREMQKQQCYFPENSEILLNSEGTANGFKFEFNNVEVIALPGPPREIEAIWRDHLQGQLLNKTKNLNKWVTRSWDTIGLGESDVAFKVEEALKDRPRNKKFEIGYRVHLPYIEVKLSYEANDEKLWSLWLNKIEVEIAAITVARDFADVASLALKKIQDLDFTFYDFVSEGFMHARLSPFLKTVSRWSFKQSDSILSVDLFENEDNFLVLLPFDDDKSILIYSIDGERKQLTLEAPMKAQLMNERRRQYFAEMALVELAKVETIK
jgi:nicotinamide-nucleotide amidase